MDRDVGLRELEDLTDMVLAALMAGEIADSERIAIRDLTRLLIKGDAMTPEERRTVAAGLRSALSSRVTH